MFVTRWNSLSALYSIHQAAGGTKEKQAAIADKENIAEFSEDWQLGSPEVERFERNSVIHGLEIISFCSTADFFLFDHNKSLLEQHLLPASTENLHALALDFCWCRLLPEHYKEIANTVDRSKNIKELTLKLDLIDIPARGINEVFLAIGRAYRLSALEISFSNTDTYSRDNNILYWLEKSLPKLTEIEKISINISKNYCSDSELNKLMEVLRKFKKLKSLDLNISNSFALTRNGFDGLMVSLGKIKTLDALALNITSSLTRTDNPVRADSLIEALSSLPNLAKIKVTSMDSSVERRISPFSYEEKIKLFDELYRIRARAEQKSRTSAKREELSKLLHALA